MHTGLVTITSTYGGVDYAESAQAHLYFAGTILYRLNGPTTFKNINFDFEDKNNIIVARFNPLTFDEGCVMLKTNTTTVKNQLCVLGGYQDYTEAAEPAPVSNADTHITMTHLSWNNIGSTTGW